MEKITFKQYLESKEQLFKAINEIPVCETSYIVNSYCKLPVISEEENKQYVSLKPKHKLIVEWLYKNENKPEATKIILESENGMDELEYKPVWSNEKFTNWLLKNTRKN